ncbi:MAG: hypothetical protein F6K16_33705 [Symploca sp. SIO2B6]|nr:hypothetical protein [Symploca sp. SIO2B6]
MSEERANLFRNIRRVHEEGDCPAGESLNSSDHHSLLDDNNDGLPSPALHAPPPLRKRGRPATGKRSDPDWIGRTYYVKRAIDLDVEGVLVQLKRQGIELDKSELVNSLLGAWVAWQQSSTDPFPTHQVLPHPSVSLEVP